MSHFMLCPLSCCGHVWCWSQLDPCRLTRRTHNNLFILHFLRLSVSWTLLAALQLIGRNPLEVLVLVLFLLLVGVNITIFLLGGADLNVGAIFIFIL